MNIFNDYAQYYDLLYRDKDYAAEAQYVHTLIQTFAPGARTLLDLGCGTGGHAFPLAQQGYQVTGVDFSTVSITAARTRLQASAAASPAVTFHQADIRTLQLNQRFDAITALFHVLSYQTTHADLCATLNTVKTHLTAGGVFVCDFWYGPGVLYDPPKVAVRRLENDTLHITRLAEPQIHVQRNVVDVNYTLFAMDKTTRHITRTQETHPMRYFFQPELERYLAEAGLELMCLHQWMTQEAPQVGCWLGVLVGKEPPSYK